ncbi:hypothetical protein C7405_109109 [Paraburkholderia caballeronis]|uniref:hypothetical protein n=1 Tax=Paraburkholderia caballeronis TaxID=416943 RepID=UPI001066CC1A|nr:hypothetical protein [Paraburkholderia caballeronis]TDV34092.1 hypothetical protein C7405_109109 [Paraburkholderia caballeronis]
MKFARTTFLCVSTTLSILLAACGGGGGDSSNGSPSSPGSGGTSSGSTNVAPLQSGSSYVGTVGFGDTIRVDLDQPAAGQLTLTFVNSQFGLAGQVVGHYQISNTNQIVVSGLAAGTGSTLSAAQASALSLSLTLAKDSGGAGLLSGSLSNVPNLLGGGGLLQGQLALTNNGVTTLAALAGTYSLVALDGDFSKNGVPVGAQSPEAGQVRINADGTSRFCFGKAYSDTCTNLDTDTGATLVDTATFTADPDQTTYPGAFDMTVNGQLNGRAFVTKQGGNTTLFIDRFGTSPEGTPRTGSMILTSTRTLNSTDYDGQWVCTEPDTTVNNVLTGKADVVPSTFSGQQMSSTDGTQHTPLNYNSAFDLDTAVRTGADPVIVQGVDGLIAAQIPLQTEKETTLLLPVNNTTMYWLDEPNGSGFFVMGVCSRQAAQ